MKVNGERDSNIMIRTSMDSSDLCLSQRCIVPSSSLLL